MGKIIGCNELHFRHLKRERQRTLVKPAIIEEIACALLGEDPPDKVAFLPLPRVSLDQWVVDLYRLHDGTVRSEQVG